MRLRAFAGVAVVAAICAGGIVDASASGSASATEAQPVPAPTVTGPIAGQPAALSAVGLGRHGYVEEEFFVEGTARAYEPAGPLNQDGRWNVQTTTTAPYRTRVLVRRPKDPAKFNGVVEVEWLNVSGGLDAAPDWGLGNAELLRSGSAWVGVSAQSVGVNSLKNDPARYGTLDHPGDAYSYDIYSQVGEALRRPTGTNLLGNRRYKIRTMIGDGESQSAFRMVTYVDAIQPQTNLFDGFFVHSRFAVGAAARRRRAERDPEPDADPNRHEEAGARARIGDGRPAPSRRPPARRRARYRLWEVAGTSHFDEDGLHALTGIPKEQMVTTPPLGSRSGSTRRPSATSSTPPSTTSPAGPPAAPPRRTAPLVAITTGDTPTIQRDELGNAHGGIRLPELEAPVATLSGEPGGGPGFCSLFGTTTAFDAARLSSLYPTHRDYVTAFSKATDRLQRDGFLLPADAKEAKADASRSAVGG